MRELTIYLLIGVVQLRPSIAAAIDGCGIQPDTRTRIVGGHVTFPGRWPWMAALYKSSTSQYCAGTLISDRHVLTAAHCVSGVQVSKLLVRLGEFEIGGRATPNVTSRMADDDDNGLRNDRPDQVPSLVTDLFGVERATIHPQYEPRAHLHDIAVLRLNRIVRFSNRIQRICLPPPTLSSLENQNAFVAGWGTLAFMGASSPLLREVQVPIWNNQACFEAIGKHIYNSTLCAGGKEKPADACQGDSGGPLMLPMADERWAAVGVVSWGIRCGEPGKPGVYTRTSHYTEWILNAVQKT